MTAAAGNLEIVVTPAAGNLEHRPACLIVPTYTHEGIVEQILVLDVEQGLVLILEPVLVLRLEPVLSSSGVHRRRDCQGRRHNRPTKGL